MLKIYGSRLCPDCVRCVEDLTNARVSFEYHDFSDELMALKIFLSIRDQNELFHHICADGKIGIPCIVREDGSVTLEWNEFM